MRQGEAGMYHRDQHRYKEAQKGNPDTERHHSRIHSVQKIAVNHIYPKLHDTRVKSQIKPDFPSPSGRRAHPLARW